MKVALLGITLLHTHQAPRPCLALYNLKLFAQRDNNVRGKTDFHILEYIENTDNKKILTDLLELKPDLIAVSCYLWSTKRVLDVISEYLKSGNNAFVLLGGPDTSDQEELIFKKYPFVSAIAYGEGEETFRSLLRSLEGIDTKHWKDIPGIMFIDSSELKKTPLPEPLDVNLIPPTIYDDEFVKKYGKWLYMETARGCKYKCAYCNYNTRGYARRIRSLDDTIATIDYLDSIGGHYITFLDAGFNQDKDREKKILRHILSKKGNISLADLEINVEDLDDEEIELINKLSSGRMGIGLQTTNQIAQKNIYRSYNEEKFRSRIKKLESLGMEYILDMICGLPGDNYETFKKTYDDAVSMSPASVNIFLLSILPGTRLRYEVDKHGIVFDEQAPYRIHYCNTYTKEDIKKSLRLINANSMLATFNSNSKPFQIICRESGRRPSELIEELIAGNWRQQGRISDEEIDSWRHTVNIEAIIRTADSFFKYIYGEYIKKEMPIKLRDICELQYQIGRVNAGFKIEQQNLASKELDHDKVLFSTSKNVGLVRLNTDVYKTLKYRKIELDHGERLEGYTMLVYRNKYSMRSFQISEPVAHIISTCYNPVSVTKLLQIFTKAKKEELVSTILSLNDLGVLSSVKE